MNCVIRNIKLEDCEIISKAFEAQNWNKPTSQYLKYLEFHNSGERDVIIANIENQFAGYLTINWNSHYKSFNEKNIPEIVDFNVLEKFQRKGIGTLLMDEAEKRIKQKSDFAGIGYNITQDFGKAQILYARRNYIPDGNGAIYNSKPINYGDKITIDYGLVMHLIKKL